MARVLSPQGLESIFSTTGTSDVWLCLLELVGLTDSFYVVNNNEDITSRGKLYTGYPFTIILPEQDSRVIQQTTLRIDNVNKIFTDWIRNEVEPPSLKLSLVMADTPDQRELHVDFLMMVNVKWDARTISAQLNIDDLFNAAFPSRAATYDPLQFPGLF